MLLLRVVLMAPRWCNPQCLLAGRCTPAAAAASRTTPQARVPVGLLLQEAAGRGPKRRPCRCILQLHPRCCCSPLWPCEGSRGMALCRHGQSRRSCATLLRPGPRSTGRHPGPGGRRRGRGRHAVAADVGAAAAGDHCRRKRSCQVWGQVRELRRNIGRSVSQTLQALLAAVVQL